MCDLSNLIYSQHYLCYRLVTFCINNVEDKWDLWPHFKFHFPQNAQCTYTRTSNLKCRSVHQEQKYTKKNQCYYRSFRTFRPYTNSCKYSFAGSYETDKADRFNLFITSTTSGDDWLRSCKNYSCTNQHDCKYRT